MKKFVMTVFALTLLFSATAFSAQNAISETAEAISAALAEYQASYPDAQTQFKGVRAATATSSGAKVKIYLNNSDETIDFGCHRHSAADPFECHEL
tara:strand:+ start:54887 stop:55174 length:288 start_codon:yes stop_codon:yes gene_type:complete